jgi:DNA-binding beta-propeller fold protein YncE/S-formylglutathione hydrolase FrmB
MHTPNEPNSGNSMSHAILVLTLCSPAFADAIPDYKPVPGWPKLPPKLELGPISAVATDAKDLVFVAHRGLQPVLVFDRDGAFIRSWGDEHLKTPHGLRIDHDGNVWLTDIGNHQVMKFDPEGKLLLSLGKKGQPGDAADQFDRPTDVAVSPSGEFYITDGYGNSRVLKFDRTGKLLKQWGTKGKGAGEFNLPHAIVLDAKGRLYVGDRENNRVQLFDRDGKFLEEWKESGAPYGLFLAGDRLFVADGRANWVRVLGPDGKPLGRFGEKGTAAGQFQMPHMLCVDSRGDVYVAEVNNKRIQKFTAKASPPADVSDAKRDENGFLVHEARSPLQAKPTLIRVLLPNVMDESRKYPVVYVLPVEAGTENRFGDGLKEIKKLGLHNKADAIFVAPTFTHLPWYADHPTKPEIRQESYFLDVVVPYIDRSYPVRTDTRLLLGFSKSGWGAWSLLLRHPETFHKAAAWDAPLRMDKPGKYGSGDIFGTPENFEGYRVSKLLEDRAVLLQKEKRLILLGYGNFRAEHEKTHDLMMRLKIAHDYRDGPERKHDWHSGWVKEAVELLLAK